MIYKKVRVDETVCIHMLQPLSITSCQHIAAVVYIRPFYKERQNIYWLASVNTQSSSQCFFTYCIHFMTVLLCSIFTCQFLLLMLSDCVAENTWHVKVVGPQIRSATGKDANLQTWIIFSICGLCANVALCGFTICRPNLFCDLRTKNFRKPAKIV